MEVLLDSDPASLTWYAELLVRGRATVFGIRRRTVGAGRQSRAWRRVHARLDDGAAAKVGREELDVERCAHQHDAQVRVCWQQVPQQDQQEVREAVPLMDLRKEQ